MDESTRNGLTSMIKIMEVLQDQDQRIIKTVIERGGYYRKRHILSGMLLLVLGVTFSASMVIVFVNHEATRLIMSLAIVLSQMFYLTLYAIIARLRPDSLHDFEVRINEPTAKKSEESFPDIDMNELFGDGEEEEEGEEEEGESARLNRWTVFPFKLEGTDNPLVDRWTSRCPTCSQRVETKGGEGDHHETSCSSCGRPMIVVMRQDMIPVSMSTTGVAHGGYLRFSCPGCGSEHAAPMDELDENGEIQDWNCGACKTFFTVRKGDGA